MAPRLADPSQSVLLIVDVQTNFLKFVEGGDRIVSRSRFLAQCAHVLGIDIVATIQNPDRFGPIEPSIEPFLSEPAIPKMRFSAIVDHPQSTRWFSSPEPSSVIVCGTETHICVSQTVADLIELGNDVVVCEDALGSRTTDRHELGMKRIASFGASIAHSEAVVYEWLRTADHPRFRDVLDLVKRFS